jgi:hypothetical protein
MKLSKIMVITALTVCFITTSALAVPETSDKNNTGNYKEFCDKMKDNKDGKCKHHKWDKAKFEEFQKDPVKALENRKKELQTLVKDGKLTQEKADAISKKIDVKIKEINEFNKLSLQEKKDKLKEGMKTRLEQKVRDGRINQDQANKRLKEINEKIDNWDGNGYPRFFHKGSGKISK